MRSFGRDQYRRLRGRMRRLLKAFAIYSLAEAVGNEYMGFERHKASLVAEMESLRSEREQ